MSGTAHDTRTKILLAYMDAVDDLVRSGHDIRIAYMKPSIEEVSSRAGCAVGTVYRYYKDKQRIVDDAYEVIVRRRNCPGS